MLWDENVDLLFLDSNDGNVLTFPAPHVAQLPPVQVTATPTPNDGNQKVLIGALAVVLIILAAVGLRSHGE